MERPTWRALLVAAPCLALLALACGRTSRQHDFGPGTSAGGSAGSGGNGGASGAGSSECTPIAPRLVRLSFPQLTRALGALLGPELERALEDELGIDSRQNFRALDVEGNAIGDGVFAQSDSLADRAGEYVGEHFAEITGCAENPTYDCVKEFVWSLAERAYRRPITDAERDSLEQQLIEAESFGATVEEAARYGAYAVFESPGFVYRTEFGLAGEGAEETLLAPHELASSLSFFITGGPPDQELLEAAAEDQLSTPEAIAPHVERLLSSEAGRANLEAAMLARFGAPNVELVVLDPAVFPSVDRALIDSMSAEARAFVQGTLWSGGVSDLLTSRRTRIDQRLAEHYGLEFPPAGASVDDSGFADIELPEEHSGFLTKAAALTGRARPERASVVLRGTWVRELLCLENPPFPDFSEPIVPPQETTTEREKAEARMETPPCNGCHVLIDPFGLALDQFDAIGRFRTEDENGNLIDPAVTLPEEAGGLAVANAVELGAAISGEPFIACMAKSFFDYALAEGSVALDGCEVEAVLDARSASGDLSFSELVRKVALSKTLTMRGGAEP